jgi:hypothetical protein
MNAMDSTGHCCPDGAVVGGDGVCCTGVIDGCGTCNGSGVAVDMQGECCTSVLTASGECCRAPMQVDDCGVCGGRNECTLTVSLLANVMAPAASLEGVWSDLRRNLSQSLGVSTALVFPIVNITAVVSATHCPLSLCLYAAHRGRGDDDAGMWLRAVWSATRHGGELRG